MFFSLESGLAKSLIYFTLVCLIYFAIQWYLVTCTILEPWPKDWTKAVRKNTKVLRKGLHGIQIPGIQYFFTSGTLAQFEDKY